MPTRDPNTFVDEVGQTWARDPGTGGITLVGGPAMPQSPKVVGGEMAEQESTLAPNMAADPLFAAQALAAERSKYEAARGREEALAGRAAAGEDVALQRRQAAADVAAMEAGWRSSNLPPVEELARRPEAAPSAAVPTRAEVGGKIYPRPEVTVGGPPMGAGEAEAPAGFQEFAPGVRFREGTGGDQAAAIEGLRARQADQFGGISLGPGQLSMADIAGRDRAEALIRAGTMGRAEDEAKMAQLEYQTRLARMSPEDQWRAEAAIKAAGVRPDARLAAMAPLFQGLMPDQEYFTQQVTAARDAKLADWGRQFQVDQGREPTQQEFAAQAAIAEAEARQEAMEPVIRAMGALFGSTKIDDQTQMFVEALRQATNEQG